MNEAGEKLELRYVPLEQAVLWERNAKKHDFGAIIKSIRRHGFLDPMKFDAQLNDGRGGIVEGNGRATALRDMCAQNEKLPRGIVQNGKGWLVPILFGVDAESQAAAEAYAVDHNNITMLGGDYDMLEIAKMWEPDGYAKLLQDLREAELPPVSMDDGDIAALLRAMDAEQLPPGNDDEHAGELVDKAEELNRIWQVKFGDLWECGEHRIICGDCTHVEVVTKLLGDEKPNLMVTDPPYGVEYDPNWRNEVDRANGKPYGARAVGRVENDEKSDWREAWTLFEGNIAYVWHAGKHGGQVQESLEVCGLIVRNQIIWAKPRFVISRGDYHWQHEPCWYAVRKNGKGNWCGDRSQTTLWQIEHNKSETGHGTQKPFECMARPVRNNSEIGDLVYDPFLGSGTTMIACENLKRKCRAIELNPAYVAVALQRWSDLTGKIPQRIEA